MTTPDRRRRSPGVDRLLSRAWCRDLAKEHGRALVTAGLRALLERMRDGRLPVSAADEELAGLLRKELARAARTNASSLRPVINATGVILHTNLGRAPLAAEAVRAMAAASAYGNLEFDLAQGERGSRYLHGARLLAELTGAEDAVVVNNGAGALALALASLAKEGAVAVSHGELVEIGGGFRIPEVIESAGLRLMPVGTTNCTRPGDYIRAVEDAKAGAILKVHRSNFSVSGFTSDADIAELASFGAKAGVPVIHDLGSGLLMDPAALGLPPEPTAAESVSAGASVVVFSGDKLLGGPQAGILVGKKRAVSMAKSHPMCRALRSDKITLAGLEATLALYRDPDQARERIPVLRMISTPESVLDRRARGVLVRLREHAPGIEADVEAGESLVGGGTFPGTRLPTRALAVRANQAEDAWLSALRAHDPPVVARSHRGRILLDLRTVSPEEDATVVSAVARAASQLRR